jgi:hypothetical protein
VIQTTAGSHKLALAVLSGDLSVSFLPCQTRMEGTELRYEELIPGAFWQGACNEINRK